MSAVNQQVRAERAQQPAAADSETFGDEAEL